MEFKPQRCRVCLAVTEVGYKAHRSYRGESLMNIFRVVTGHPIEGSEPQSFCYKCYKDLVSCFEFCKRCDETQELLKTKIHQTARSSVALEEVYVEEVKREETEMEEEYLELDEEVLEDNFVECEFVEQEDLSEGAKFECKPCQAEYQSYRGAVHHFKRSHKEGLVKCENCSAEVIPEFLETHVQVQKCRPRISQEVKESLVVCPFCGKGYSPKRLQGHIHRSHPQVHSSQPPVEKLTCDLCQYRCRSKQLLKEHMKTSHISQPPMCPHCGYLANRSRALMSHMRKHHSEIYPLIQCKTCDYRTHDPSLLYIHRKRQHPTKPHKDVVCEDCGRSFSRLHKLNLHRQRSHSDARNFVCSICSKAFKIKTALGQHMKTHDPKKDYECMYCFSTFRSGQNLRLHIKNTHGEEKLPPQGTVLSKSARPEDQGKIQPWQPVGNF